MIRAELLHEFQPGGRREDGQEESTVRRWFASMQQACSVLISRVGRLTTP